MKTSIVFEAENTSDYGIGYVNECPAVYALRNEQRDWYPVPENCSVYNPFQALTWHCEAGAWYPTMTQEDGNSLTWQEISKEGPIFTELDR